MPLSVSILSRLQYQHETIAELIEGLDETQLKQRVNPDKWGVFENIVHLTAYQHAFIQRMASILAGGSPFFERYVAEKDPLFYDYLQKPLPILQEDLALNRRFIRKRLEALNEEELNRYGLHPKYGAMTMIQWTEFFLLHEAHHLFTIFMLTQDLRALQRK